MTQTQSEMEQEFWLAYSRIMTPVRQEKPAVQIIPYKPKQTVFDPPQFRVVA